MSLASNAATRLLLLQQLYRSREAAPASGWESAYVLRQHGGPGTDFALAVLLEPGWAQADGPRYRITGAGVAAAEAAATGLAPPPHRRTCHADVY